VAFAVASLALGAIVLLTPKGTARHRRLGFAYAACMLALNVTALSIYEAFGTFGPFHVLSNVSLATLLAGLAVAFFRWPPSGWVYLHYEWMSWSYVGLCAAAASEAAVRVPGLPYAWSVVAASTVVILVGGWIVRSRRRAVVSRVIGFVSGGARSTAAGPS